MGFPKTSIIIPVYNVEKYLEQCVDSIIEQDVGFESNIELILVNDGSKDASGQICERYAERYPANVVYITQKNAGASEARNTGMDAARGEFIGFVDADDYISKDVVSAALKYFQDAPADSDVAICRVVQFGSKNRERPINKKFFWGTRTADLKDPGWYDVYPRIAPAFIRTEKAKKYRFHKDTRFYEDTRYITEILAENMKLGVVDKGVYYNRMHDQSDSDASITTGATSEKRFYLDSPEKVTLYLLKKYKGKGEYPPLYMQYLALYEMRWRMFFNPSRVSDVLSRTELLEYNKTNKAILDLVSDEAIVGNKLYNVRHRVYLLNLKHSVDILTQAKFDDDDRLKWRGLVIFNHMKKMTTRLTDVSINSEQITLKGYFDGFIVDGMEIYPRVNGRRVTEAMTLKVANKQLSFDTQYDDEQYERTYFVVNIARSRRRKQRIDFCFTINETEYRIGYIDPMLLFEGLKRQPRYFLSRNCVLSRQKGILWIAPESRTLSLVFPVAWITLQYLIKLTRRGLGKVKRLCIRMIRMLK